MRDISFRAWNKKNKHMFYAGSLSGVSDFYLTHHTSGGYEEEELYNCFPSVFYDWMQYTGLKDKSGKEIYEGDIIRIAYEDCDSCFSCKKGIVEYDVDSGAFCVKNERGLWQRFGVTIFSSEYMVIGNIYENPELWEVVE